MDVWLGLEARNLAESQAKVHTDAGDRCGVLFNIDMFRNFGGCFLKQISSVTKQYSTEKQIEEICICDCWKIEASPRHLWLTFIGENFDVAQKHRYNTE
jgi:hypothetical protein